MELFTGTTDFQLNRETAVVIGKFDGIHVGHHRLLDEILEQKKRGLAACVFTFDPAPAVFFGLSDGKELTTREEKRIFFERMGIDVLIEYPMNAETAATPPETFVTDVLAGALNADFIAAGPDLSFGDKGRGNLALLQKMAPNVGIRVASIDKVQVEIGGQMEVASSTLVRSLVEAGRMEDVETLLGTPYPVLGTVVHGRHMGHSLGFPTVNLLPEKSKLLPPNGVYSSEVRWEGHTYRAVSNVGCKPTISDHEAMGVETYLYDFDGDLYGENVEIYLKSFRRPEQRFASLEDLKAQLARDISG